MQFWKSFVLAGKAIFTLEHRKTGTRFTYKVSMNPTSNKMWFVGLLAGPDNLNDYTYIGCIWEDPDGRHIFDTTRKSKVSKDSPSFQWFNRLVEVLDSEEDLPNNMHLYHASRCARCGRVLTVPASIECGFGPECVVHVGMAGGYGVGHISRETAQQIRKLMQYQALHEKLQNDSPSTRKENGRI